MLLAAMLAMVLAAAAPAFGQAVIEDDDTSVQYVDCSQVQQAIQGQYGDANAAADDGSIAAAANTLGISQTQVNACLGTNNIGNTVVTPGGTVVPDASVPSVPADDGTASPEATATAAADDEGSASATAAASAPAELPETGGASLLALGAGALLVAGGLVARRIVR